MKEFLGFIYLGCLEERDDFVAFCILGLLNVIVWCFTIAFMVYVLDYLYKVDQQQELPLVQKVYHEDYYYNTMVGNVVTVQYSPERFELIFDKVSCNVREDYYNSSDVGEYKTVSYYTGLTSLTYCTDVK